MNFKGKVVLVTGTANKKGIGYATVKKFLEYGADAVAAIDYNPEVVDVINSLAEQFGGKAVGFVGDVSNEDSMRSVITSVVERFGRIDCVVNCAALNNTPGTAEEVSQQDFIKTYLVNVWSQILMPKLVIPIMKDQGIQGSFVDISSVNAFAAEEALVIYGGSKGAIRTQGLFNALDYAKFGIRFNVVAPGLVNSGFNDNHHTYMGTTKEEVTEHVSEFQPLGKATDPEEVANAIVFLSSDLAKGITGAYLPVDGGYLIR